MGNSCCGGVSTAETHELQPSTNQFSVTRSTETEIHPSQPYPAMVSPMSPKVSGRSPLVGLSASKLAFLQAPKLDPVQLSLERIWCIASQYCNKHRIEIIANGSADTLAAMRADAKAHRIQFLRSDVALAGLSEEIYDDDLEEEHQSHMLDVIGHLLPDVYRQVRRPLIPSTKAAEFARLVEQDPILKPAFEKRLNQLIGEVDDYVAPFGLLPRAAADELAKLTVRADSENKFIGFLYGNSGNAPMAQGVTLGGAHTDAFVVVPGGLIINAVPLRLLATYLLESALCGRDRIRYASSHVERLIESGDAIAPLAGEVECGSLALSYMKEYLKNDGQQLRENCLLVGNIETELDKSMFLLPSPEVLRYSQSTLYIKVLRALVAGEHNTNVVEHGEKRLTVTTLPSLLQRGATISSVDGKSFSHQEIASFRQAWLRKLDEYSFPRREAMYVDHNGVRLNGYLAHVVKRHEIKCEDREFRAP